MPLADSAPAVGHAAAVLCDGMRGKRVFLALPHCPRSTGLHSLRLQCLPAVQRHPGPGATMLPRWCMPFAAAGMFAVGYVSYNAVSALWTRPWAPGAGAGQQNPCASSQCLLRSLLTKRLQGKKQSTESWARRQGKVSLLCLAKPSRPLLCRRLPAPPPPLRRQLLTSS